LVHVQQSRIREAASKIKKHSKRKKVDFGDNLNTETKLETKRVVSYQP